MKLDPTQNACALCHKSLKWWDAQTCTRCGKKICSQHGHMLRRPHSTVLFSVCAGCAESHVEHTFSLAASEPVHA